MKCPNCGAEVNGSFCSFCGTEMPKQPVNIINNYYGTVQNYQNTGSNSGAASVCCPNCGSSKISFNRESTGARGYHKTVGVCKSCGNTWVTANDLYIPTTSSKNKTVAMVLCIFLGYLGCHYFYVGKAGMGVLYLLTMGLFGIGWIVDIIRIAGGSFKDVNGLPLY